jgi:uncharacterized protein (TIGR03435 family)
MWNRGLLLMLLGALLAATQLPAQNFEVASIKPAAPDARGMGIETQPGGRVNMKNVTPALLISMAWDVRDFQLTNVPAWMNTEHFDIVAKPETEIPRTPEGRKQLMLAVQQLLHDRFGLVLHKEQREMPIYALVVAKNGPKLTAAAPETQPTLMGSRGKIEAKNNKMADFARILSDTLGRTVVDKTGLATAWDFTLTWTPDMGERRGMKGTPQAAPQEVPEVADGPSIFTAIQEQLGLKLESQKGPVDVLVIDHAERPSEN